MNRLLLILSFLVYGCDEQKKELSQPATLIERPLQTNSDCLPIEVTTRIAQKDSNSIIYLNKASSIDSMLYIECDDQLLLNPMLLDSIQDLPAISYLTKRFDNISNLYFIRTLSETERLIDFGFYPIINHKAPNLLLTPIFIRYLRPTGSFYIKEDYLLHSMEEWILRDSLNAEIGCSTKNIY